MKEYMTWQDHGPGTLEWECMFGGNNTGLYNDKTVYAIGDDRESLDSYVLEHSGGSNWVVTDSLLWDIDKLVVINICDCNCI